MTEVTIPERRKGIDPHASRSSLHPADRDMPDYSFAGKPDAIERVCKFCTLALDGGKWEHDPACIGARASRTA